MEIEARQASLSTMAVTINALHVNGKQMTLSVFRQLPIAQEDEHSEIWGVVKYKIKHEGEIWIVFSKAGILMRRALSFESSNEYFNEHIIKTEDKIKDAKRSSAMALKAAEMIVNARAETPSSFPPKCVLLACGGSEEKAHHAWDDWVGKAWESSKRPMRWLSRLSSENLPLWVEEERDRYRSELTPDEEKLASHFEKLSSLYKLKQESAERQLEKIISNEADRKAREHELAAMPQLFIAV